MSDYNIGNASDGYTRGVAWSPTRAAAKGYLDSTTDVVIWYAQESILSTRYAIRPVFGYDLTFDNHGVINGKSEASPGSAYITEGATVDVEFFAVMKDGDPQGPMWGHVFTAGGTIHQWRPFNSPSNALRWSALIPIATINSVGSFPALFAAPIVKVLARLRAP